MDMLWGGCSYTAGLHTFLIYCVNSMVVCPVSSLMGQGNGITNLLIYWSVPGVRDNAQLDMDWTKTASLLNGCFYLLVLSLPPLLQWIPTLSTALPSLLPSGLLSRQPCQQPATSVGGVCQILSHAGSD